MAFGPFSSQSEANDDRIAATGSSRVRVARGKSRIVESGAVSVGERSSLNSGIQLSSVTGNVTIDGGSAALAASNERFAGAIESLAAGNNSVSPLAAQVTAAAGAGTPADADAAADASIFERLKNFWSELSTGAKIALGLAAAGAVYLILRRR